MMDKVLGYCSEGLSMDEEIEEWFGVPRLAIVGVGGAGNNSMGRLEDLGGLDGVDRIAINTDKLHLDSVECERKLLIGKSLTHGLGSGGAPDVGRKAAELDREVLGELFEGKNFVFLTAGMGGGTGTGAAPVIAEIAKEAGAIVVAMVSFPFEVERRRRDKAAEGIKKLRDCTDTVIVLENDKLLKYAGNLPVNEAFKTMDTLIADTIQGIAETITQPSLVNLDFADLKSVMEAGGVAVMLVGETSKAENKSEAVVEDAFSHPLLDADYRGAKGALIHVTGGSDLTMKETNDIVELLTYELDQDANVIWGARINEGCNGTAKVSAIMTGVEPKWTFGGDYAKRENVINQKERPVHKGAISDIIPVIR
ncbi:cell division protein FtsZ [ANME-1 cluster archaeon AG-394-G21]|nr:cell division protein FtsZ [ANME-1 cluster archaeon AG-394-G21]NAT10445.1 cell division protein FtsZ [ANME-1 cluster archaeon AG-394-G06]